MDSVTQRLGSFKASIDNGFSRVGPGLRADSLIDGAMASAASRLVRLSNAVVLLCQHHHAEEAILLLGGMVGIAMAMRWMAVAVEGECEDILRGEGGIWDWTRMGLEPRWVDRCRLAGVSDAQRQALDAIFSIHAREPWRVRGIPWAHVFAVGREGPGPSEIMGVAVAAMGHAVKALNTRWPGAFPGGDERVSDFKDSFDSDKQGPDDDD